MPARAVNDDQTSAAMQLTRPTGGDVVMFAAGLTAVWVAAGSTGFLAHPLNRAITWLALGVATIAGRRSRVRSMAKAAVLAAGIFLAVLFTASAIPVVNILAVAVLMAAIAQAGRGQIASGLSGRLASIIALAATMLACYRLACGSIPAVWHIADAAGRLSGQLIGWATGRPVALGATFAGIDFLVVTASVYAAWLVCTEPPRRRRAALAAVAILVGHFVYLVAVAGYGRWLASLPEPTMTPLSEISHVGRWTWENGLRTLVPWNLPLLALAIHGTILTAMMLVGRWRLPVELSPRELVERQRHCENDEQIPAARLMLDMAIRFGPPLLATAAALLATRTTARCDLSGKTIVAYQGAAADWTGPQYDAKSDGPFAMLPLLVESLGGKFALSKNLSKEDLAKADAVLLLRHDPPLREDAVRSVCDYARRGGSVLIAASGAGDDLAASLGVPTNGDSARAAADRWEQCCDVSTHSDRPNALAMRGVSPLTIGWADSPLVVGRWGVQNDASSSADSAGKHHAERDEYNKGHHAERDEYNTGHRAERDEHIVLGDLVLAAERRVGEGRVVVLGGDAALGNETLAGDYPFVGRLLGDLAQRPSGPQDAWRQLLGGAALAAMFALLCCRPAAWQLLLTGSTLAVVLIGSTTAAAWSARALPDGRRHGGGFNNVAYIDASHLESYESSPDDRRSERGVAGLARTLMRHGYLPLLASDLTPERLRGAGLLISIGPAREFSAGERTAVKRFVEDGGTMICLVGAEEARPSAPLLADFGLKVSPSPVPACEDATEPEPLGAFRQIFADAAGKRYVDFYAGWPVEESQPSKSAELEGQAVAGYSNAMSWVLWSDGKTDRPIVVSRSLGSGQFVVIGDTHFADNENLEAAVDSLPNNIRFWRWLLSRVVSGQKEWNPPQGSDETAPAKGRADEEDSGDE